MLLTCQLLWPCDIKFSEQKIYFSNLSTKGPPLGFASPWLRQISHPHCAQLCRCTSAEGGAEELEEEWGKIRLWLMKLHRSFVVGTLLNQWVKITLPKKKHTCTMRTSPSHEIEMIRWYRSQDRLSKKMPGEKLLSFVETPGLQSSSGSVGGH